MYKEMINWKELDFLVDELLSNRLNTKTLSQRIYRAKTKEKLLTLKLAMVVYNMEKDYL